MLGCLDLLFDFDFVGFTVTCWVFFGIVCFDLERCFRVVGWCLVTMVGGWLFGWFCL